MAEVPDKAYVRIWGRRRATAASTPNSRVPEGIPWDRGMCGVCGMRAASPSHVSSADRCRLEAVVKDRNAAQKHVGRAAIVLDGPMAFGTNAIHAP